MDSSAMTALLASATLTRARALLAGGPRQLLGIAGAPGSGKSSFAAALAAALDGAAVVVPMDGFHLANAELARLGLSRRKGAPETFDSGGFIALLQRLRRPLPGEIIYAPAFYRELEEPIAGCIAVPAETALVIVEGNYLLLDEAPWQAVRGCLDQAWFLDVPTAQRQARLLARHQRYGRSRSSALAWMANADEPNARRIEAAATAADYRPPWPPYPGVNGAGVWS